MRPDGVVFVQPLAGNDSGLSHGFESPAVQTRRAEDAVKAFVVGVLPGTTRIDVVRIDAVALKPCSDLQRNEFRTIVAAQARRSTVVADKSGKSPDDIGCREAS